MNKLQGKDLINVGIFTAIYFVVMMAIAMLGFIPIFLPLLIVLVPLIGGIVMMLYYSKVQKYGIADRTDLRYFNVADRHGVLEHYYRCRVRCPG